MPTFTKTAGNVVDAVIQDGQVQTTNRNALLDYTNRTSLRILRESQWAFLQSEYQKFITVPGIDSYWIGTGPAPAGMVNTGLNLSDVESILPDSVFDLTNGTALTSDAAKIRNTIPFLFRDGTIREGQPRGYHQSINQPNVIKIFPVPDNKNPYTPSPLASVCSQTPGGVMPGRTYYLKTTFVDSKGNEGTPSELFIYDFQAGQLAVVQSPPSEIASATSTTYNSWNIYASATPTGTFLRQNIQPIPIGTSWLEPALGLTTHLIAPTQLSISRLWVLIIDTSGNVRAAAPTGNLGATPLYVTDPLGRIWQVSTDIDGRLMTSLTALTNLSSPVIQDSAGIAWLVHCDNTGALLTTSLGLASSVAPVAAQPPTVSTLVPLEGYVIGFRYQKPKIQIVSPSSFLQIPDSYFDVVIAGVNYYANLYTSKGDDENIKAPIWKQEFLQGLAQIRRDLRQNYRNSDFIAPDKATQGSASLGLWNWTFS